MKFTAPPNWPQPPVGWTPPPGWSPDPAWGPAPDGWQFWAEDDHDAEAATRPIPTASTGQDPDALPAEAGRTGRGLRSAVAGAWASAMGRSTRHDKAEQEHDDGEAPADPAPRSRTARRIAASVAGVALFAGGIGIGAAVSDPTSSDEYLSLASAKADVEGDYEVLLEEHEELRTGYDEMSSGLEEQEAAVAEREEAVKASEDKLKEREGKVKDAEGAVKKREEAVSGAEQKKAENTIREGTWTVGVDIAPGTYRATSDVGSRCYWAILATGTNGDDIIANDIPGGGRPSVTISEGQDFETKRCGTWQLQ